MYEDAKTLLRVVYSLTLPNMYIIFVYIRDEDIHNREAGNYITLYHSSEPEADKPFGFPSKHSCVAFREKSHNIS